MSGLAWQRLGGVAGIAFVALFIALSAIPTRSLSGWLAWSAAVLAAFFAVTQLGILSDDEEGGVLGIAFFLGLLVQFLWVLGASVVMIRTARAASRLETRPVPA